MSHLKPINIFISSPGDVAAEREKAKKVIEALQKRYVDVFELKPLLWEDLPLGSSISFQQGIDLFITNENKIDLAIFIMWSRLGSPLGSQILDLSGKEYRSGTEREWDLMMRLNEATKGEFPHILTYIRDDKASLVDIQHGKSLEKIREMIEQRFYLKDFISEQFHDADEDVNIRAYFSYPEPVTFSVRLREHLKSYLDSCVLNEGGKLVTWNKNPYRGLQVFEYEHAGIFFGREREIIDIQLRLNDHEKQGCSFILVVGASGSGKSSLIRAGVVPEIIASPLDKKKSWRFSVMTPASTGASPFRSLFLSLSNIAEFHNFRNDDYDFDQIIDSAIEHPLTTYNLIFKKSLCKKIKLLLIIDQLEELFLLGEDRKKEVDSFILFIKLMSESGYINIITTLRSDYYSRFQEHAVFLKIKGTTGQYDLLPPTSSGLERIISEPARLSGIAFEKNESDISLSRLILDDASQYPEALPILEFTLSQLYEQKDENGVLSFNSYKKMGGIKGAITTQAELMFQSLNKEVQAELSLLLSRFIKTNIDSTSPPVRRRVPNTEIKSNENLYRLVKGLSDERLIILEKDFSFFAHEAIIEHWHRIRDWLQSNQRFLVQRAQISSLVKLWVANNYDVSYLLAEGHSLSMAAGLFKNNEAFLNDEEKSFILKSQRKAAYTEMVKRRLLYSALSILVIFCLALTWLFVEEKKSRKKSQSLLLSKQANDLLKEGHLLSALNHANKGYSIYPSSETRSTLLESLKSYSPYLVKKLFSYNPATSVSWSKDNTYISVGDIKGNTYIWNIDNKEVNNIINPSPSIRKTLPMSLSQTWLNNHNLTNLSKSGHLTTINRKNNKMESVRHIMPIIFNAHFSKSGNKFIASGLNSDGKNKVSYGYTNNDKKNRLIDITAVDERITAFSFSPDEKTTVLGSQNGSSFLFDPDSPNKIRQLFNVHKEKVTSIDWSSTLNSISVGTNKGSIELKDMSLIDDSIALSLPRQIGSVTSVSWQPNQSVLATATTTGEVKAWRIHQENDLILTSNMLLGKHEEAVLALSWSFDGKFLASGSQDNQIGIWQLEQATSSIFRFFDANEGLHGLSVSPDGSWIAVGGQSGNVYILSAADLSLRQTLSENNLGKITALSWHPTENVIVAGDRNGTLAYWRWSEEIPSVATLLRSAHDDVIWQITWSNEGDKVYSSSEDRFLKVWSFNGNSLRESSSKIHNDFALGLAIGTDKQRIFSGSTDGKIRIWQQGNELPVKQIVLSGPSDSIGGLAVNPVKKNLLAAASNNGSVYVLDITNGEEHIFKGQVGYVEAVSFDSRGDLLASGGGDGYLRIWDIRDMAPYAVINLNSGHIWSVAWIPNTKYIIVTTSGGKLHLVNLNESSWKNRVLSLSGAQLSKEKQTIKK